MKASRSEQTPHKLGANRNEPARKPRKLDPNFSQCRDVREDRGRRQAQTARSRQTLAPGRRG
jgi:hypothetical protein